MYTKFFLEQILHAFEKNLVASQVCELGSNSWDTRLNGMLKAKDSITVCETPQEFFKQKGSTLKQYNRTPPLGQKTVLAKDVFENSIDILPAFNQLHHITAPNGVIIMNLPIGITCHVGSISIGALIHIAQVNHYEVPFFAISNENGDVIEKINTNSVYNTSKLKELLYKFRETIDLRLAATFIKTSEEDFQT